MPSAIAGAGLAERDEKLSRLLRLRKAGTLALVAWPLFGILDWFIVNFVEPGRLGYYLALRVLGLALIGLGVAALHSRRTPSSLFLGIVDTFISVSLMALVSVQCLEFRGIASPLALGIVTILLCRSVLLNDHWKRSIVPIVLSALTYPAILVGLAFVSPQIRNQFNDPQLVGSFVLNVGFVMAAAAITLFGGHAVWSLRRQVSQSRSLGRYELKALIGQGGMGEVWSAYHQALRRNVAVKILRPDSATDSVAVSRFEREVRATAELNHPNTVRVYDYGVTEDGLWYYAMELLEGEDLGTVVRRGPVAPIRAVDLINQASRALGEAHLRGIVHRDIKPENLFLTSLGGECDFVKVLDFGLAKIAQNESRSNLTQAGWAVGTPSYVSPEVVMGKSADARSDVYALGSVLYALLTGSAPFAADDMRAVLMAHLRETPTPPSVRLGRPIPRNIEAVVMRALEKDPDKRFANGADLARALASCLQETPQTTPLPRVRRQEQAPLSAKAPVAPASPAGHTAAPVGVPGQTYAPTYIGRADWGELNAPPRPAARKSNAEQETVEKERPKFRRCATVV